MGKIILTVVFVLSLIVSCVPVEVQANPNITTAVLVAASKRVSVYKFNDGDRECYITESTVNGGGMMSSGASIWCSQ